MDRPRRDPGLYEELTDWLPTVVDLDTIHPRAARYLCEYPTGSGRWYAAPCETDAVGMVYRRDWFEDPAEQAAFQERYGYALAAPDTWEQFRDVAEFFHRPDEKRYGCVLPTGRSYDSLTMGVQNLLWAFGGAWKDPESNRVVGFLDTPESAAAVDFLRELLAFGPNGAQNMDYGRVLEPFVDGSTAMQLNYFAFFPDIHATFGDKVGFAPVPAKDGRRIASLGGQGFSISTNIPEAEKELSKRFIAWFLQTEVQKKWITKPAASPPTPRSSERGVPGPDPLQRSLRRLDRHHAGLLERAALQRADGGDPALHRRGPGRQPRHRRGLGRAGQGEGTHPAGSGAVVGPCGPRRCSWPGPGPRPPWTRPCG